MPSGEPVDERTESNPLYDTGYVATDSFDGVLSLPLLIQEGVGGW
jgi:hypothetical protein